MLTGAPNLYDYKGKGPLPNRSWWLTPRGGPALRRASARPGADHPQARRVIRGVESYSMVCSEKELGISEEHEGVIFLDPDAPTGMPLAEYMGDAVFESH